MEKINLPGDLRYAHGGHRVVTYPAGEWQVGEGPGQMPEEVAIVAVNDHGAKEAKAQKSGGQKGQQQKSEGEGE